MSDLVLLAGLPGSGKTTWAQTFFDLKYAIVSSDAIRKQLAGSLKMAHDKSLKPWDLFYHTIRDKLTHDVDVIADATFLTRTHRERARGVAEDTRAKLHIILFTNWMAAHERNKNRDGDARVPGDAMEGMYRLYWDTLVDLPTEAYASVTHIETFNTDTPGA